MRRLFIVSLIAALSFGLAGCAIVDLAAHTVKAVEKNQRDGGSPASSSSQASASRPAASSATAAAEPEEPSPPQSAPLPRRSTVTAEELPPR